MLRLLYSPGTIASATAITLFEVDLPFEPVQVDFANADQTQSACCAYIKACCLRNLYVLGNSLSSAAPWLFTISQWPVSGDVNISPFDRLNACMQAMETRPSVKVAHAAGIF